MAELSWESIECEIKDCRRCGLCMERNSIVLGEGNRSADIMFIGDTFIKNSRCSSKVGAGPTANPSTMEYPSFA